MTLAELLALCEDANKELAARWPDKDSGGWLYCADVWEAQDFIAACSPEVIAALVHVAMACEGWPSYKVNRRAAMEALSAALAQERG